MMDVNYNSDKVVFVYYRAGSGGAFINRLIHFSKELPSFDPPILLEDMFKFSFEHNGKKISSANCHGKENIWVDHMNGQFDFPYGYKNAQDTKNHINRYKLDRFVKYLNENEKLMLFRVHNINFAKQIFPKSKTVYLSIDDAQGKYFQLRSYYEKLIKSNTPDLANGKNKEGLFRIVRHSIMRKEWVSRKIDVTESYDEIPGDKFKLLLSKILNKDEDEYNRLCNFLKITPSQHYKSFVDAYMAVQWKRKSILS